MEKKSQEMFRDRARANGTHFSADEILPESVSERFLLFTSTRKRCPPALYFTIRNSVRRERLLEVINPHEELDIDLYLLFTESICDSSLLTALFCKVWQKKKLGIHWEVWRYPV